MSRGLICVNLMAAMILTAGLVQGDDGSRPTPGIDRANLVCLAEKAGELPRAGVTVRTKDPDLQLVFDGILKTCQENIRFVKSGGVSRKGLVEGDIWIGIWMETQPMGGAMYGKINLEVARNNVEIVLDGQAANGLLPHLTNLDGTRWFGALAFNTMAESGLDVYYLLSKDKKYLKRLGDALERYDRFLWRTRDTDGDGCLEQWCTCDTGEDGATRFDLPRDFEPLDRDTTKPAKTVESVCIMADSFANRAVLAKIAGELGNGREAEWTDKAAQVREKFKSYLWIEERAAAFDRDSNNRFLPTLSHINLPQCTRGYSAGRWQMRSCDAIC